MNSRISVDPKARTIEIRGVDPVNVRDFYSYMKDLFVTVEFLICPWAFEHKIDRNGDSILRLVEGWRFTDPNMRNLIRDTVDADITVRFARDAAL